MFSNRQKKPTQTQKIRYQTINLLEVPDIYFTRKGAPVGRVELSEHVIVSFPDWSLSVKLYSKVSCSIDSTTSTEEGIFRISGGWVNKTK